MRVRTLIGEHPCLSVRMSVRLSLSLSLCVCVCVCVHLCLCVCVGKSLKQLIEARIKLDKIDQQIRDEVMALLISVQQVTLIKAGDVNPGNVILDVDDSENGPTKINKLTLIDFGSFELTDQLANDRSSIPITELAYNIPKEPFSEWCGLYPWIVHCIDE